MLPSMIHGLCRRVPNEPSGIGPCVEYGAIGEGYKKAPAGWAWRRCSTTRRVCFVRSIAVDSCTCALALASDAFRIVLRRIIATPRMNCYTFVNVPDMSIVSETPSGQDASWPMLRYLVVFIVWNTAPEAVADPRWIPARFDRESTNAATSSETSPPESTGVCPKQIATA